MSAELVTTCNYLENEPSAPVETVPKAGEKMYTEAELIALLQAVQKVQVILATKSAPIKDPNEWKKHSLSKRIIRGANTAGFACMFPLYASYYAGKFACKSAVIAVTIGPLIGLQALDDCINAHPENPYVALAVVAALLPALALSVPFGIAFAPLVIANDGADQTLNRLADMYDKTGF